MVLNKLVDAPACFLPGKSFNPSLLAFVKGFGASSLLDIVKQPGLIAKVSPSALKAAYYASRDPLHPALAFATGLSVVVWLLGEITGNVSQVDRLWTFLPVIYSTHFTFWPKWSGTGSVDDRMFLVWVLQLLWSARLTTNTYRRGFFNPKSEDYRWEYVRQRIPKWQFSLMNLFFVAFIQNYLLLFVELPQYLLLQAHNAFGARNPALGPEDYLLAGLFVTILVFEMIADNEQQAYQHLKQNAQSLKKKDKHGGDLMSAEQQGRIARGFVTEGLWSWSRHPNFALEQSTWWVMYLFTVIPYLPSSGLTVDAIRKSLERISSPQDVLAFIRGTEGFLWNYSIWGPISMSLLFYSSTMLTEQISAGKYPLYKQYQRRVGFFWPPITTLKGIYLSLTGNKKEVDDAVYGTATSIVAKKNK